MCLRMVDDKKEIAMISNSLRQYISWIINSEHNVSTSYHKPTFHCRDFSFYPANRTEKCWTEKSIYGTAANDGRTGNKNQFITETWKRRREKQKGNWRWSLRLCKFGFSSHLFFSLLSYPVLFVFVSCWRQSSKNTFYVYDWRPHSDSQLHISQSNCTLALEKASSWFP